MKRISSHRSCDSKRKWRRVFGARKSNYVTITEISLGEWLEHKTYGLLYFCTYLQTIKPTPSSNKLFYAIQCMRYSFFVAVKVFNLFDVERVYSLRFCDSTNLFFLSIIFKEFIQPYVNFIILKRSHLSNEW